ncbi:GntR family transcriptional regulator [Streptomyces olivaceoviridis]|uniref:GntR family transcriptional regulator n=1 Tax=Streptomyces olivaceoviridis TaxID=1921 RepID=UPI0036FE509D
MLVTIDRPSPRSLAEQIAASVRRDMTDGKLARGDRLPPAHALARSLDINMRTRPARLPDPQGRATHRTSPGRGAVVTADAPSQALVIEACRRYIHLAQRTGMADPDIPQLVTDRPKPTV